MEKKPTETPLVDTKKGSTYTCKICGEKISGQFVRALNAHFHLDCFRCQDCHQVVAEKFFPLKDPQTGSDQFFCEKDYFKRLDLLCASCGGALRGPHITACNKKYHLDHFTCSVCPTIFRQHDQYFERDGQVYCQEHYSILFAAKCGGCEAAVLKNFVEMNKEGSKEQWHPECYMVYKLWNVRIASTKYPMADGSTNRQKNTVEKVGNILKVLSSFEHSSAECIQALLVHFSNQNYQEGVLQAEKFICHIEALFQVLDDVESQLSRKGDKAGILGLKEPKSLAKKIVSFFALLSTDKESQGNQESTAQLINLVSSLARQLKALIRSTLKGTLKLERTYAQDNSVERFLARLIALGETRDMNEMREAFSIDINTSQCVACQKNVEEANFLLDDLHWHADCFKCKVCLEDCGSACATTGFQPSQSQIYCKNHCPSDSVFGFQYVSLLQQYVALLRCSLKRLCVQRKVNVEMLLATEAPVSEMIRKSADKLDDLKSDHLKQVRDNSPSDSSNNHLQPKPILQPPPEISRSNPVDMAAPFSNDTLICGLSVSNSPQNSPFISSQTSRKHYLGELSPLQHMVVRQMAALKIHSFLEKYFTIDEVMELAEARKRTVWSKMVDVFKTPKKPVKTKEGTFGVPLEFLTDKYGVDTDLGLAPAGCARIPIFMDSAIRTMLQQNLSIEGIFRKNGNIRNLKLATEALDRDPKSVEFCQDGPIQIAALTKKFLRELPEPLLTFRLHKLFTSVHRLQDEKLKKEVLHYICCLLPKQNVDLLQVLFWFLREVSLYAGDKVEHSMTGDASESTADEEEQPPPVHGVVGNKMDMENLATVIAPNILYSKSKNPLTDESIFGIDCVLMMLKCQQEFWMVPDDINMQLDDLRAVDSNDPDKERELIKKFEDVIVKMKNQSILKEVTRDDGDAQVAKIENFVQ